MIKRIIRASVSLFMIISISLAATSSFAEDKVSLYLKWNHGFQFSGYYAAIEKGYYKEAGLDVTIITPTTEVDQTNKVLQRAGRYGVGNCDLLRYLSMNNPPILLATIYQHSPLIFLALKESGGINNIHDIAHKEVLLESNAIELSLLLRSEGVNPKSIMFTGKSSTLEDLISGKANAISAYSTNEPYTLEKLGIPYITFSPRDDGIDFYGDNLFTSSEELKSHPERVKAFRDASLKGWQYALSHTNEMADIIQKKYAPWLEKEHIMFDANQSMELIQPSVVEIGYTNPNRWLAIAELYKNNGELVQIPDMNHFLYTQIDKNNQLEKQRLQTIAVLSMLALLLLAMLLAAARNNKRKKLAKSERKLREIISITPVSILVADIISGEIIFANQKARSLFEITEDESQIELGSIENLYKNSEDCRTITELVSLGRFVTDKEVVMKTSSGKELWILASATKITFEGRSALLSSLVDISVRKEYESQIMSSKLQLESINSQLTTLNQELEIIASTDQLTHTWNRRKFENFAKIEMGRAFRHNDPLSIILFDIDHFKKINDSHGHIIGDKILEEMSAIILSNIRAEDCLARWGGEEFIVMSPSIGVKHAYALAEKIRKIVFENDFPEVGVVTISLGVSSYQKGESLDDWIKRADSALYKAKEAGRNCTRIE